MTQLTKNFTLEEFTDSQTAARKGISNAPSPSAMKNLERLAETTEKVRAILGDRPVIISSGYRSPKVNAAVGGSKSSAHMSGLAVDFTCPSFGAPLAICKELQSHMTELKVDQLIHEFATWCHLAIGGKERHQVLTIDTKGTRHGF